MAERTYDIWNDNDGEEPPRKHRKRRGFWVFALTLVVVLAVVLLAAYRDGTGFDVLRRYLNYGSVEKVGGEVFYEYEASSQNRFAALGEKLVVLSETSLRILDQNGEEIWAVPVNMSAPALSQGGGRAVAYDVGGLSLYVVDENGEVMSLTADEEEPFIAATLNREGWLAVTAEKRNFKGAVHVYDQEMTEVFEFKSSRRFVMDAYITDDCAYLAAVTLGQEDSVFVSNVVLYDVTKEDPVASYDVTDGLVAVIGEQAGKITAITDTCLTFADTKGAVTASYSYNGAYLRDYDLSGDDFVVLLLNRYRSGSVGRLVTVDAAGTELGSLDINEEILSISATGRYIAVLYADRLVVYNQDLQMYASLKGTGYAKEVLVRPDGSALLLSSEHAGLFLP